MEPKSDSVIIIADSTNKGPGPIIPNGDVIDINFKSDGDRDHGQDHHGYVGAITAAAPIPAPAPAPAGNNYKKSAEELYKFSSWPPLCSDDAVHLTNSNPSQFQPPWKQKQWLLQKARGSAS